MTTTAAPVISTALVQLADFLSGTGMPAMPHMVGYECPGCTLTVQYSESIVTTPGFDNPIHAEFGCILSALLNNQN